MCFYVQVMPTKREKVLDPIIRVKGLAPEKKRTFGKATKMYGLL